MSSEDNVRGDSLSEARRSFALALVRSDESANLAFESYVRGNSLFQARRSPVIYLPASRSTSPSVPTSSSICCLLMMSGGESAMMSPVVRTSTPFSKHCRNASNARAAGLPGRRLELDAGDQAEVAHVDHVRQLAQRCTAFSK